MIDSVEQAGVRLDDAPPDHLHRARLADSRFIIAVYVGAHGELGFLFFGIQQLANALGVVYGVAGAACGARNRAGFDALPFHAHEHFRRSPHQLLIAELQQEFVGTGAGALHALEQFGGFPGIRRAERLVQNHFVVVAAAHAFAHALDPGHVLLGLVIGLDGAAWNPGCRRNGLACARERQRR